MSNDVWRWADPDGQQRRVRLDELRAALAGGHIAPNAPVWRPGWPNWQSAHEVPELTSASLGGAHGVVLNIPPPPLAMVAVQQSYEKQSESLAPAPPSIGPVGPEPEPPVPPPRYVPVEAKMPSMNPSPSSAVNIPTMIGGSSGMVLAAPPVPVAPPTPQPKSTTPGLGKNIPTTLGMPSPVIGAPLGPPGVPLGARESVEELSDSHLIDPGSEPAFRPMSSGRQPAAQPPFPSHHQAPPPSDPIVVQSPLFLHDPPEKKPNPLDDLIADLKALKAGQQPKNKPVLIAAGIMALVVVLGLFGLIISLASGGSGSSKTVASASASPSGQMAPPPTTIASSVTTTTMTTASPVVPPPPPPSTAVLGECKVSGESKMITPRVQSASAIEAQAVSSGLAFGFAASARDAVATTIDPATFAPTATVRTKPGGDVKRVTPFLNGGKLSALVDSDRKGDRLGTRRSVATSPLVDIGVVDGALAWAPHGRDSSAKLFSLDGDSPVEALRAIPLMDRHGIAITFRRDNAIRIGAAKGENTLEADGDLSKIDGLGQGAGTLGSPSLASSGDRIVVAWADRASTDGDWTVRWTTVKPHAAQTSATPLVAPPGGLGGNIMSPAVASLGGGRFLLAWTEGATTNHQVRALTFAADGTPSSTPLNISAPGDNAGQPAIALNDDGKGVVAFLSAKGNKGFELHVTPISCPRQ